jgi:FkbH-like protein
MDSVHGLRGRLAALIEAGDHRAAWAAMSAVMAADPTTANCHVVAEAVERLNAADAGLTELRVAFLANFTVQPLATVLSARAVTSGLLIRAYVAPFDTWMQEILDDASGLCRTAADVVVLAPTLDGLAPSLLTDFLALDGERTSQLIDATASTIENAVERLRSWSTARVLLHSFPLPTSRALGMLDAGRPDGQTSAFRALDDRLRAIAARHVDVFVVDMDRLIAIVGERRWRDPRMAVVGGLPFTMDALHAMAEEHLRYLRAFSGRARKVLVVDADETLWGGLVGEGGVAGVALGDGYPGACFVDVQRALLELRRRGVLLALNSSNNPADVDEMLAAHPRMLLRRSDFAAVRVNWDDKAANVVSIAEELSVGLDSVVMMDDSPAECERIRTALPEVLTIHLAGDPAGHGDRVRSLGVFDTLTYGDDDRRRAARYRDEAARRDFRRGLPTLDTYYASLEMELTVEPVGPATIGRAADLTQRTNQFNLAPRRFSRHELAAALAAPATEGYIFGLRDRFGDHGLIALAIIDDEADRIVRISTLLMSCRVLKRTVEQTLLAFLGQRARDRGASHIEGLFRRTAKNEAAAAFYRERGFEVAARQDDGIEVYRRPCDPPIAPSPFVRLAGSGGTPNPEPRTPNLADV